MGIIMSDKATPTIIYHFTSLFNLQFILRAGYLELSGSNLNTLDGNVDVVWLTSSPLPKNHGLDGTGDMPKFDKTRIRISVKYKPSFKMWDEWSEKKGIKKGWKDTLISTAKAEKTHKTWYVSEEIIPLADVLKIEDLKTGTEIPVPKVATAQPPRVRFAIATDEYIFNQKGFYQFLLCEVREVIRAALPDATEKICDGIPTYWHNERILFRFAARDDYFEIIPLEAALAHFASKLTEFTVIAGAIHFPYSSRYNELALISEIAAWCGEN
jgi:uncharacterized protein YdhG (YjbR/CyaY superfamily)